MTRRTATTRPAVADIDAPATITFDAPVTDEPESFGPVLNEDGSPSSVTVEMLTGTAPVTPAKTAKPKFCFQLADGEKGCHRLPRHHGEHRSTLHRPKVTRVAKVAAPKSTAKPAARKASRTSRKLARSGKAGKAFMAKLAAAVEAGTLTPSAALAQFSRRIA